jgi:hypothetical protein
MSSLLYVNWLDETRYGNAGGKIEPGLLQTGDGRVAGT